MRQVKRKDLPEKFQDCLDAYKYQLSLDKFEFFVDNDGDLYLRDPTHRKKFLVHWTLESRLFAKLLKKWEGPTKMIACECGNMSFLLNYGEYQIVAQCTNPECNAREVIYDE